jgi:hypothetical protein
MGIGIVPELKILLITSKIIILNIPKIKMSSIPGMIPIPSYKHVQSIFCFIHVAEIIESCSVVNTSASKAAVLND